jgi:hypothetical protein
MGFQKAADSFRRHKFNAIYSAFDLRADARTGMNTILRCFN